MNMGIDPNTLTNAYFLLQGYSITHKVGCIFSNGGVEFAQPSNNIEVDMENIR